jgi:hypothetical protein
VALLALPAGVAEAARVEVVSRDVTLSRAGVAPIAVRCAARRRSCRGVVRLGVPLRHQPVACDTCTLQVGRARFKIGSGRTQVVRVQRRGAADVSAAADRWEVLALARLDREKLGMNAIARRQRPVRLSAPPALPRPPVELSLLDVVSRWGLDYTGDDNALRFRVHAPRGTEAVRVEVGGRAVDLHPDMTDGPYVVPEGSFAPGGNAFHGELPIARGEFHYGERYEMKVYACHGSTCEALDELREVDRGAYGYGDPICRLPRGGGSAPAFVRRGATHPSALAVMVAAPGSAY